MKITLAQGAGGKEMQELIKKIVSSFNQQGWKNTDDDSAIHDGLAFTTDSYVVTPLFFPGGNIGDLAFCGTVNDLAVMGAKPVGLSLGLVIEEGFSEQDLLKITKTIGDLSKKHEIPVVTGDVKVMEKGKIDKLVINTSGVGIIKNVLDKKINKGDKIVVSGSIGEHGAALLAKRFDVQSSIKSDTKPLWEEINKTKKIKQAKDITRGGLAATINELADKNKIKILLQENDIPIKKEVLALTELLGLDPHTLACEGTFLYITDKPEKDAIIIGEVTQTETEPEVVLQTRFGKRILPTPSGNLVPRIC